MIVDIEVKIWAAGLFDGEGSALIERVGRHYQIVVAVSGYDERNTNPIMENWGGHHRKDRDITKYYKDRRKRGIDSTVYFSRPEAKRFLVDILPYLKDKHEEAALVLRAIIAQELTIKEKGLRGSSFILAPYYTSLQSIRS